MKTLPHFKCERAVPVLASSAARYYLAFETRDNIRGRGDVNLASSTGVTNYWCLIHFHDLCSHFKSEHNETATAAKSQLVDFLVSAFQMRYGPKHHPRFVLGFQMRPHWCRQPDSRNSLNSAHRDFKSQRVGRHRGGFRQRIEGSHFKCDPRTTRPVLPNVAKSTQAHRLQWS